MLIVTGLIEIDPMDLDRARAASLQMMAETVKEPGCLVYEFSDVIGAPGRFRVYEEWESDAALAAHMTTPHMAVFRAELAQIAVRSRAIETIKAGERTAL